jgi:microcystin-dependent protein
MISKYSASEIEALLDKINSLGVDLGGEVGVPSVHPGPLSTLPVNKHLLNKAAVLISDYPECYAILGGASSPYGVDTGLGVFYLPEIKEGGSPVQSGPNISIGSQGGSTTHTNTEAEMFPHWHFVASDGACQGWLSDRKQLPISDFNSNNSGESNDRYHLRCTDGAHEANEGVSSKTGGVNGVAQSYSIMNPYTAMNWVLKLAEKSSTTAYGRFSFSLGDFVNAKVTGTIPTTGISLSTSTTNVTATVSSAPVGDVIVYATATISWHNTQTNEDETQDVPVQITIHSGSLSGTEDVSNYIQGGTLVTAVIVTAVGYVDSTIQRSFILSGCYMNDVFVTRTSLTGGSSIVSMLNAFGSFSAITSSDLALLSDHDYLARVIGYISYIKGIVGGKMIINPGDAIN